MKPYLWLFFILGAFLLIKITNLGIRLSDTNIYFYTAYQLLEGKILYKDIFFTNFPLFPYISSLYYLLSFKQLALYTFTSSIEAAGVAGLIFYLTYSETKKLVTSITAMMLYLFSFIVLTTSEHQTGVFLASLFAVGSYALFKKNRFFWSGVMIALALLTKAYFLPILASLLCIIILTKRAKLLSFLGGVISAAFLVLVPTFVLARQEFITDVFNYSLTRSQGIAKVPIASFFIQHDLFLFCLLICSLLFIRRQRFFGVLAVFSLVFFLFYQDIYYLYLNFAIPFLCLSYPFIAEQIEKKLSWQAAVLPTMIALLLSYNLISYFGSYRTLQKVENVDSIATAIRQIKAKVLYGPNDIAPALAYITDTKLLNNIVDTNENLYRKGFLDAKQLTHDALSQHALFISHGAYYPEATFRQDITDGIFDTKQMQKCQLYKSFPVVAEGGLNRLNLISCEK